jgi:hypothetical protein
MMLETHLRQAATVLLESAIRIAPPDTRDWGQAMRSELIHVEGPWAAVMWALGGASVLAKRALASLFIPGRRGQGIPSDAGLFAKDVSIRKAVLVTGAGCILAALLFFAAPPFRQGIRVSLAVWHEVFRVTASDGQPGLTALSKQAEKQHDPEGLAFAAARLWDGRQCARLAEEAVWLDPTLIWIYPVVAVRHPDLPEISQWVPKLERWDPQNALIHLIAAQSIEVDHMGEASKLPPKEFRKKMEEDPAWQSAMAAAFASPKFDDYLDRLKELDQRVVSRYRFNDPYELLSGEEADLPAYAFLDSQRFAESLLQSGQKAEARGDRKGAAEKYWAVARFGLVIDSQGHTDFEHHMGSSLQAGAYKQLQALSQKEGSPDEAALFGYLAGRFTPAVGEDSRLGGQWVFGRYVSRRNAAVLQISGLMMLIFSGLVVVAGSVVVVGSRRGAGLAAQRAKPVATVVTLAGAVGLLLSSATIYLTYRPYWYIFQRAILNGDRSQTRDFRDFLMATHVLPGVAPHSYLSVNFQFYFWAGVILLGVAGLVLILLRHFLGRPRANATLER